LTTHPPSRVQHLPDVRPAVRDKFKVHRLVATAQAPPGMHDM